MHRIWEWLTSVWFTLFGLPFDKPSGPTGERSIQVPAVSVVHLKQVHKRYGTVLESQVVVKFQPPLRHVSTYRYPGTAAGKEFGTCKVCQNPKIILFSDSLDAHSHRVRLCLECLEKYGEPGQLELAASKSKYARRYLDCKAALKKLEAMFPDPNRRPYGTKSLMMELENPCWGYQGIERVLHKVNCEAWSVQDLKVIEHGLDSMPESQS